MKTRLSAEGEFIRTAGLPKLLQRLLSGGFAVTMKLCNFIGNGHSSAGGVYAHYANITDVHG